MANENVDFVLRLIDKASGPAQRIAASVQSITKSFAATEKVKNVGVAAESAIPPVTKLGGSFLNLKTAIVAAGVAATAAAGVVATKFVKAATDAVVFRENTVRALTLIMKSATRAGQVFEGALDLSDKLGTPAEQTIQSVQRLMAKGFSEIEAQDLFRGMADLKQVVPTANIDNAINAIEQIKSKGVVQMEELRGQLGDAGLNITAVIDAIGRQLGKSSNDVRKMLETGKISADVGIMGILTSIQELTGKPLGKATEEASRGLGGMLERFKELPNRFFVELSKALDATGGTGALQELWATLGPDSDVFKQGVQIASNLFSLLGNAVTAARPLVDAFLGGFGDRLGEIMPRITAIAERLIDGFSDPATIESIRNLGTLLGQVVDIALSVVSGIVGVAPALLQLADLMLRPLQSLMEVGAKVVAWSASLGPQIIQGLVSGLRAGLDFVSGVAAEVADAIKSPFNIAFKFGSPSKVMMELGGFVGEGFGLGVQSGMAAAVGMTEAGVSDVVAGVEGASVSMMAPANMNGVSSSGGGGGTIHFAPVFNITQHPGESAEELADEIEARVRRELKAMLEVT